VRALNLGSGIGDLTLLAGEIVGSSGYVASLDRDAIALGRVPQRAAPCTPNSVYGASANTSDPGTRPGLHQFSGRSEASL